MAICQPRHRLCKGQLSPVPPLCARSAGYFCCFLKASAPAHCRLLLSLHHNMRVKAGLGDASAAALSMEVLDALSNTGQPRFKKRYIALSGVVVIALVVAACEFVVNTPAESFEVKRVLHAAMGGLRNLVGRRPRDVLAASLPLADSSLCICFALPSPLAPLSSPHTSSSPQTHCRHVRRGVSAVQ